MTFSIGEELRRARTARKLSLEQVAQQTRIRLRYLEAMEQGNFEVLPSNAQARGFLRTYALALNLDPQPLLAVMNGGERSETEQPLPEIPAGPVDKSPASRSETILAELGTHLRQQRELLGLSLEDIEQHTHIRVHYLKALETGNLPGLPSPVQGRGMLSNYAIFLGFDPEPLLLRFAEGLQADLADRQAARARLQPAKARLSIKQKGRARQIFSADLLLGGFLVVFITGFIIWGALRVSSVLLNKEPTSSSPSIAEVLSPQTETPSPSPSPSAPADLTPTSQEGLVAPPLSEQAALEVATPTPSSLEPVQPAPTLPEVVFDPSSVQVYLVVRQRAWVLVTVDGDVELNGRVIPGSAYLFSGNELIEILTGNGAALQVYFNQQDQGILGSFGEVVKRAYSPSGEVKPTATSTSLPTSTASPTPTITPTVTPLP